MALNTGPRRSETKILIYDWQVLLLLIIKHFKVWFLSDLQNVPTDLDKQVLTH